MIYGIGLASTFAVLLLMHANAYRLRDRLGLNELERAYTRIHMAELAGVASLGLLSGAFAQLPIGDYFAFPAGYVYFLTAVVYTIGGRRRRALARAR